MTDQPRLKNLLLCAWWLVLGALPLAQAADTRSHILLQDSPLAGFQYHQGKQLWPEMKAGDTLMLVREPDNPHDAKAIRVEWHGHKLGYVPRRENTDIARMMDNGAKLEARITRLAESRDPWQRIRFEILAPVQAPQ
jgi:hypothetical protein